jgi:hypothetical protein
MIKKSRIALLIAVVAAGMASPAFAQKSLQQGNATSGYATGQQSRNTVRHQRLYDSTVVPQQAPAGYDYNDSSSADRGAGGR